MSKINVTVTQKPSGYMKIEIEGHTETDICAAVSTAIQSNARFIHELAKQYPEHINFKIKNEGVTK